MNRKTGSKKPNAKPTPARGRPKRPEHLTPTARKWWDHYADELDQMGVLATADCAALAVLATVTARWEIAEKRVAEMGKKTSEEMALMVGAPKTGVPMHNPYRDIAKQEQREMLKWLTEFGLTPSSRSTLHVEHVADDDGFDLD